MAAAARVLPLGADARSPEISLWFSNGYPADITRLPKLDIELMDDAGETLDRLRTSGMRGVNSGFTQYPAYLNRSYDSVVAIRVSWGGGGLLQQSKEIAWKDAMNPRKKLRLLSEAPIRMLVMDAATGKPVRGSSVWKGTVMMKNRTLADGRVAITHLTPLAFDIHVAADGYEPKRVELPWPWTEEIGVHLTSGGRTVRGRVVDEDGEPISGASISPGLYTGYTARSDANGGFVIPQLDDWSGKSLVLIHEQGGVHRIADIGELFQQSPTTIEMPEPGGAVVAVTEADQPAADTWTRFSYVDGGREIYVGGLVKSDAAGIVNLEHLGPERYEAQRARRISNQRSTFTLFIGKPADFQVRPGQTTNVRLDRAAGHRLAGRIVDESRRPMPQSHVVLTDTNERVPAVDSAQSQRDGRFEVSNVPAGEYKFKATYTDPDQRPPLGVASAFESNFTHEGTVELTVKKDREVEVVVKRVQKN